MTSHRGFLAIGLCLLALISPIGAAQQTPGTDPLPVTVDLLDARIAETESAADLPDETKNRLLGLYRDALSNLKAAAAHKASARTGVRSCIKPHNMYVVLQDLTPPPAGT